MNYNLDMIISVGYRVNSYRGTQFRIWATQKLTEFIKKGFVMDDDRLAHGGSSSVFFDLHVERVASYICAKRIDKPRGLLSLRSCFRASRAGWLRLRTALLATSRGRRWVGCRLFS